MPLEGHSIVCVSQDWQGDPTSKTHIMRVLARTNRILWVNSIGMRSPTASAADLRRMASKLFRGLRGSRQVEPNIQVADPLVVPIHGHPAIDRLNAALLSARLRRLGRTGGTERPILWTFLPNAGPLVGRLGERLVVYHCVDEYAGFSGVPKEALQKLERDLVRRADIVFASAERLCEERRPLNPHTHFIPHGVDAAHFGKALDARTEVPDELQRIPRPVVGFMGLIADWVDLGLVHDLAVARPGWSFVLLGKTDVPVDGLAALPNVHLLGRKPYALLPSYCKGFDVGIIPFRTNDLTLRANPLKLREYLAAGLPVVATPLPEVSRYRRLVRLAGTTQEFAAAIEAALAERGGAEVERRIAAMRPESWEARVERMSEIVEERMQAAAPAARKRTA